MGGETIKIEAFPPATVATLDLFHLLISFDFYLAFFGSMTMLKAAYKQKIHNTH